VLDDIEMRIKEEKEMSKSRSYSIFIALASGIVLGVATAGTTGGVAQTPDAISNHHKDFSFTLLPGGSQTFFVPKKNGPVRYEISAIGGHPQFPGMKTFIIVHDASKNITAYYDLLSSGGPNLLASSSDPSPLAQPFDFACAELHIGLGGRVTITRIPPTPSGDCQNLTDPVSFSVSLWY
jgi:hypothetical protein